MGRCGVCTGRAIAETNVIALEAREAQETLQNMQATELCDVGYTLVPELHKLQQGFNEKKLKGEISAAYDLLLEEDILRSDSHDQDFRKRGLVVRTPLVCPKFPRKVHLGAQKKLTKSKRSLWSTEALHLAIEGLDEGYKISEVCKRYNIHRSSLKDHVVGRCRGRKMGPKIVLSMDEEEKLCEYIELMVK